MTPPGSGILLGMAILKPEDRFAERDEIFVASYLTDFNGARAARLAGWAPASAGRAAYDLLRQPRIKAAIEAGLSERLARAKEGLAEVEANEQFVLRHWIDIVKADVNELVQHRRHACRYCYGEGGRYQRTQAERDEAEAAYNRTPEALVTPFDEQGGVGYDATREPNPKCFECFGEGVSEVHVADTRDLTPGARALLAGIKQTKDGIEVKMHSKEKALEMLARHLGMLTDKLEVDDKRDIAARLAEGRARARGEAP